MQEESDGPACPRPRPSVRQQILQAAVELFAKGGSRGTALSAIAKRTGVTAPAITHHFGSKQQLLSEVIDQTDRLSLHRLEMPVDAPARAQLTANRGWARLLLTDNRLANLARLATVMTAEAMDGESPARQPMLNRHRRFRRLLVAVVRKGQRDGSIRSDIDPRVIAAEVIAFMHGAQMHWFLDSGNVPLQQMFDDYFSRLDRDLAPARVGPDRAPDPSRRSSALSR